jgi:hypothetical protein
MDKYAQVREARETRERAKRLTILVKITIL